MSCMEVGGLVPWNRGPGSVFLTYFGSGEIVVSQRSPVYSGRTLLFGERVNLVSWNDCGGPLVSLLGRFGVLSIRQGRERALSRNTLGQTHLDDDD